jgi:hypothetical protein
MNINDGAFLHVWGTEAIENDAFLNCNAGSILRIMDASGGDPAALLNVFGELHVESSGKVIVETGGFVIAGGVHIYEDAIDVTASSTVTLTSSTLQLDAASDLNLLGDMAVGAVSVTTYTAGAKVNGDVETNATNTVKGPSKQSGNNAYHGVRFYTYPSATGNVDAHKYDIIIPATVLGGNITWTLQDPPDTSFQVMVRIVVQVGQFAGHTLTVRDVAASFSIALAAGAATNFVSLDLVFSGAGTWLPCGGAAI